MVQGLLVRACCSRGLVRGGFAGGTNRSYLVEGTSIRAWLEVESKWSIDFYSRRVYRVWCWG